MNMILKSTLALMLCTSAALADPAGLKDLSFAAPHHDRDVTGAVYYPSAGGGTAQIHAANPVFDGVPVLKDAQIAVGNRPLVLMSHGMGGNIRSLGWLSAALAERGAIVVAVNHPNSTWGDFDLAEGLNHWTRAQDLKLALDTVLADPELSPQIDPERIMAAGFSYGGWTALSLGGLRGNHAGYVAHCAQYGAASSHCADLMHGDVGLETADAALWNANHGDARVRSVFAIDPGLIWGMGTDQTADMISDITLISLGEGDSRLLAANFDLAGLPAALPQAKVISLVPGAHFSMMPLCTPNGAAILADEKDDPVCTDPEGTDRAALHEDVIAAMAAKLGL